MKPKHRQAICKKIEECIHYLYIQGDIAGFDRKSFAAFTDIIERWALWVKKHDIRNIDCANLASYRSLIHLYYNVYGTPDAYFVLDVLEDMHARLSRMRRCF